MPRTPPRSVLGETNATMSDTSGDSSVRSRKKSFSSMLSRKMDKLSNPFKKGDRSDSDSDDDDGIASPKGKSSSLFGGKLSNPFKKSSSSASDDEGGSGSGSSRSRSPPKARKSNSSASGEPGVVPPMPSHFALSPKRPDSSKDPVEAGLARGEDGVTVPQPAPIPDSMPPLVAPPGTAAAPAAKAVAAPSAPTEARAPAGTAGAVLPAHPVKLPLAGSGGSAAAAAGDDDASAAAPAEEPKKPRVSVGGPVFGAPDILLTGVKGDPDEVMKALRARGFVVHLVRSACVLYAVRVVVRRGPENLVDIVVVAEAHLELLFVMEHVVARQRDLETLGCLDSGELYARRPPTMFGITRV